MIHIQKHEGDPLYTRYWEIMQDEALGLIQPTMKGALRKLLEPGHFLITGSHLFVIENYLVTSFQKTINYNIYSFTYYIVLLLHRK